MKNKSKKIKRYIKMAILGDVTDDTKVLKFHLFIYCIYRLYIL